MVPELGFHGLQLSGLTFWINDDARHGPAIGATVLNRLGRVRVLVRDLLRRGGRGHYAHQTCLW